MPPPVVDKTKLGELICNMNPYASCSMLLDIPNALEMEVDDQYAGQWSFKGESYRVKRALRIEYCYKKTVGGVDYMITDYLLIGYEGAGP